VDSGQRCAEEFHKLVAVVTVLSVLLSSLLMSMMELFMKNSI
jgi:hypothetical protein